MELFGKDEQQLIAEGWTINGLAIYKGKGAYAEGDGAMATGHGARAQGDDARAQGDHARAVGKNKRFSGMLIVNDVACD